MNECKSLILQRGIVIHYDRFFFVPVLQREGQSESVSQPLILIDRALWEMSAIPSWLMTRWLRRQDIPTHVHAEQTVTRRWFWILQVHPGVEFPLAHTFHLHRWVTAGEEKRGARTEWRRERGGAAWKRRWRDQRKGVDGFPVWINEEEGSCLINELSVRCAPSYTSAGSTSHNTNISWMLFSRFKEPLVYQIFSAFRDN